ncbi:hypothetical protein EDD11_001357 [Mortierella claussenii]|nr:hypothetical protein EDD11_001357 [Mortierella claussenii]
MILESPPLVNLTKLAEIHEVPIHIRHPIYPNSANKHKRLGLQMLNDLSRIEMFVTRIETVGKVTETLFLITILCLWAQKKANGLPNKRLLWR